MGGFKKFDKSRGNKGFGGSKFGGARKFGGRSDDRGDGPKQMFDATCSECNRDCQVPFRPSGGNPVFCSNCFKKQDGGSRSSFVPRKPFGSSAPSRSFGNDSGSSSGITKVQFDTLTMKLDKIIALLKNTPESEGNDFAFEEKKSRKFLGPAEAPIRKARGKRS